MVFPCFSVLRARASWPSAPWSFPCWPARSEHWTPPEVCQNLHVKIIMVIMWMVASCEAMACNLQLLGGFSPTLKNDGLNVSWDDFPFPTEWKAIKFHSSKPPTSQWCCCFLKKNGGWCLRKNGVSTNDFFFDLSNENHGIYVWFFRVSWMIRAVIFSRKIWWFLKKYNVGPP